MSIPKQNIPLLLRIWVQFAVMRPATVSDIFRCFLKPLLANYMH